MQKLHKAIGGITLLSALVITPLVSQADRADEPNTKWDISKIPPIEKTTAEFCWDACLESNTPCYGMTWSQADNKCYLLPKLPESDTGIEHAYYHSSLKVCNGTTNVRIVYEPGFRNRAHGDWFNIYNTTRTECPNVCEALSACVAIVWQSGHNICWIKNVVTKQEDDGPLYQSGVKGCETL